MGQRACKERGRGGAKEKDREKESWRERAGPADWVMDEREKGGTG